MIILQRLDYSLKDINRRLEGALKLRCGYSVEKIEQRITIDALVYIIYGITRALKLS